MFLDVLKDCKNRRGFHDLAPPGAFENLPSPQETVRAYCNYLCEFGMLESVENDSQHGGNFEFRILSRIPIIANIKNTGENQEIFESNKLASMEQMYECYVT